MWFLEFARQLACENFAFGELNMFNFMPFLVWIYIGIHEFWGLHASLPITKFYILRPEMLLFAALF